MEFESLLTVEKQRHAAIIERKKIFDTMWYPMFDEYRKAGRIVWGYQRHKNGHFDTRYRLIFRVEKSSYHDGDSISYKSYEQHQPEWLFTLPLEELGLLIGEADSMPPERRDILKARLSGTEKQIPHNQGLIDLYWKIEKLFEAQNTIIGHAGELIEKYLSNKLWKMIPEKMRQHEDIIAILHINGREYHWLPRQTKGVFRTPETEIVHIYETDILADEQTEEKRVAQITAQLNKVTTPRKRRKKS